MLICELAICRKHKITRREKLRKDASGSDMDEIKITFQDNGNEQNYYLLKLMEPIFEIGDGIFYVNIG